MVGREDGSDEGGGVGLVVVVVVVGGCGGGGGGQAAWCVATAVSAATPLNMTVCECVSRHPHCMPSGSWACVCAWLCLHAHTVAPPSHRRVPVPCISQERAWHGLMLSC